MNIRLDPHTVEIAFWLILCGGLGGLIGQQTDWGHQLHARSPDLRFEPVTFVPPALSVPPHLNPPDQYLEAFERPLFVFYRRPPPPPPPPVPQSTMKKGQFKLSGASIVGDKKMAFLIELSSGRTKVVREGETINDMIVQKIEPGMVTLVQGNDQEQLELKIAPSKGPAPQAK